MRLLTILLIAIVLLAGLWFYTDRQVSLLLCKDALDRRAKMQLYSPSLPQMNEYVAKVCR